MNKQEIINKVDTIQSKITFLSTLTILQGLYESAAEKKQYKRCNLITELIREEIN